MTRNETKENYIGGTNQYKLLSKNAQPKKDGTNEMSEDIVGTVKNCLRYKKKFSWTTLTITRTNKLDEMVKHSK